MKHRAMFVSLLLMAAFLALAPGAAASNIWYANGVSGSDSNSCRSAQTACKTIGHAILLASPGDSIMVAPAIYKENLTLTSSLNIWGSRAATTIIDGQAAASVVTVSNGNAKIGLSQLTIQNGFNKQGGGIYNAGILTISNVHVTGNVAGGHGGGIGAGGGVEAGIYNSGTLTINNSTVGGNQARGNIENLAHGGGIYNSGTVSVNGSTISSNNAYGLGGGIVNDSAARIVNSTISGNNGLVWGGALVSRASTTISNSTISGNSSQYDPGGIDLLYGTVALQNSIVADNSGGNCYGTLTSSGHNLSSDATCNFNGPGDMNHTDPLLGPLQNNGGPTQTMALLPGSLALDAGNPSGCTDGQGHLLKTDQRGQPRPDKEDSGGCDIGAYERQSD